MDVRVGLWKKLSAEELMLLNCGVGEDSCESLGLQGDPTSPFWRRSALGFLWKEWCYSWNSSTLATSCKELTHWKRLWCWEGLGAGREGDDRGWDSWMASLTRWTWVWVNSGNGEGQGGLACCDTWGGKESDMTERLNWTELKQILSRSELYINLYTLLPYFWFCPHLNIILVLIVLLSVCTTNLPLNSTQLCKSCFIYSSTILTFLMSF